MLRGDLGRPQAARDRAELSVLHWEGYRKHTMRMNILPNLRQSFFFCALRCSSASSSSAAPHWPKESSSAACIASWVWSCPSATLNFTCWKERADLGPGHLVGSHLCKASLAVRPGFHFWHGSCAAVWLCRAGGRTLHAFCSAASSCQFPLTRPPENRAKPSKHTCFLPLLCSSPKLCGQSTVKIRPAHQRTGNLSQIMVTKGADNPVSSQIPLILPSPSSLSSHLVPPSQLLVLQCYFLTLLRPAIFPKRKWKNKLRCLRKRWIREIFTGFFPSGESLSSHLYQDPVTAPKNNRIWGLQLWS